MRFALLLALAGCAKRAPELVSGGAATPEAQAPAFERVAVVGPVRWWDATGLCLDVPASWSGLGLGERGVLLSLTHQDTAASFEVMLAAAPRDRRDLVPVFEDDGTYRDLPALGPAGVESWTSDVPGGPSLHVWNVSVRGVPIRVEARYPFGRVFTGSEAVDGLLRGLCLE